MEDNPNEWYDPYPQNGLEATPRVPLIDLVSLGMKSAVKEFLQNPKVNIDTMNDCGSYATLIAIERNDLEMLQLLLNHNAKLYERDLGKYNFYVEINKNPIMKKLISDWFEKNNKSRD
ncbi:hypothetical protein ABK040_010597 [Willaertia magna]